MTTTRRRILTVILAPTAALATWALIRLIGIDLVVSTGSGRVGPFAVTAAATGAALAGWGAARALERLSSRPRAWWSFAASAGLAHSIMGPSWLADGSSAVALIVMHFVTASVVIAGFVPTIPEHRRPGARRTAATDLRV